jgi:hypothetical protein
VSHWRCCGPRECGSPNLLSISCAKRLERNSEQRSSSPSSFFTVLYLIDGSRPLAKFSPELIRVFQNGECVYLAPGNLPSCPGETIPKCPNPRPARCLTQPPFQASCLTKPPELSQHATKNVAKRQVYLAMQHFLNFLPLPHGQGSFLPTFCSAFWGSGG